MKKLLILLIAISLCVFALTSCDALTDILGSLTGGNQGGAGTGTGNGGGSGNGGAGDGGASFDDTKCTQGLTFELSGESYTVSGYTGTDAKIYIPASYEGKAVTSVKAQAFRNNATVTELYIPKSVTEISAKAFENASYLTKVQFYEEPASLTVGASAFSGCSSLKSFNLPSTTVKIAARAFGGCNQLFIVDGGCSYVGDWVVSCELTATSANIKAGTVGIADSAFSQTSITAITLPTSLKYVGDAAFLRCSKLGMVDYAPNATLEVIGKEAFSECSALENVKLPATVREIGESAFKESHLLSTLTIADGCERYFTPDSKMLIDRTTKTLTFGCHVSDMTIPSDGSVEIIGDYAFLRNSMLERITIPTSVKKIGNNAFGVAKKLKTVTFPNNSNLEIIDDSAFYNSGLQDFAMGSNSKLRVIGELAFADVYSLKTVVIPASVEELGKSVFAHDWTIYSISFDEGSKLKEIPPSAFVGCRKIRSVSIPDGVTKIGKSAFYCCYDMTYLYIPASVVTIEEKAFSSDGHADYTPMKPVAYCEAAEKPEGWADNWLSDIASEPIWGYSRTEE